MNLNVDNFHDIYAETGRFYRKGWLPIVIFSLLSIPGWIGMGMIKTPDFRLILIDSTAFQWQWFWHGLKLSLAGFVIAAVSLAPATFWLLRIYRGTQHTITARDIIIGTIIPGLLDFALGITVTMMVLSGSLMLLVEYVQVAESMSVALRVTSLVLMMGLVTSIFGIVIGVIYPRFRWLAVASLSGDCTLKDRIKFLRHIPKEMKRILWRITTLEQVAAFVLTIVGASIASRFINFADYQTDPMLDQSLQFYRMAGMLSRQSGPMIAFLNGLGWIAIWGCLPMWIIAYEALPKPVSAARFNAGKMIPIASQTD